MKKVVRHARKVFVALIGVTIVLTGIAFFVLPGPGFIIVILGLAVLASEFAWAQGLLDKARDKYDQVKDKVRDKMRSDNPEE